jgi:hypothetical protein
MAITYLGGVERILTELETHHDTLDQRYRELLGDQKYTRLQEVQARVLTEESFCDNIKTVRKKTGEIIPDDAPSKLLLLTGAKFRVEPDGRIRDRKVKTSAVFYLSEQSFQHSSSSEFTDNPLVTFIHEYNHFVTYALQKVPIYVAMMYLSQARDLAPSGDINEYVQELLTSDLDPRKISQNIGLTQAVKVLDETQEKGNRILDKLILQSVGIDVPLPWRFQERQQIPVQLPTGLMVYGQGGDPYRSIRNDQDVLDKLLEWETYMAPPQGSQFMTNLLREIKRLKTSRVSFKQMRKKYKPKQ